MPETGPEDDERVVATAAVLFEGLADNPELSAVYSDNVLLHAATLGSLFQNREKINKTNAERVTRVVKKVLPKLDEIIDKDK